MINIFLYLKKNKMEPKERTKHIIVTKTKAIPIYCGSWKPDDLGTSAIKERFKIIHIKKNYKRITNRMLF